MSERPRRVAIVGGGPAGLMAAEVLATAGVQVTLYEQSRSVGRKFLLAGRGGLNITHTEPLDDFLGRYFDEAPWLEQALRDFPPAALRDWCMGLGQPTFEGTSGRVFPEAFRATPLLRAWLSRLDELGVEIATRHRWTGWDEHGALRLINSGADTETSDTEISGRGITVQADAVVFALGGASWPRTGSDGLWQPLIVEHGVEVAPLAAANCGLAMGWSDIMRDRFAGQPVKNVSVSIGSDTVECRSARGDLVITDYGLEGGPIYALGRSVRAQSLDGSGIVLMIDLLPDLPQATVVDRLSKRRSGASLTSWLSSASISDVTVALVREATGNNVPTEPEALAAMLKALPLSIESLAPIDRAISSAGGVRRSELDDNYMVTAQPGTFMAGEMLDWEAPTGGYLLQACFSTGVAAAQGVLSWLQAD